MILKSKLKEKFSTIPNRLFDCGLSSKAIHLFCYLATKPENWVVYNADVKLQLDIKDDATIAKVWRELLDACWIERKIVQDPENKKIMGGAIIVLMDYDSMLELKLQRTRVGEKPVLGKNPNTAKIPTIINNNKQNKTEEEKYKKESGALPPSRSDLTAYYNKFVSWWNDKLRKKSDELDAIGRIPKISVNSAQRQQAFKQRWKNTKDFLIQQGQNPTDDDVFEYMTKKVIGFNYINSLFLRGEIPPTDAHPTPFDFTVDFVLRPTAWTKLLENEYIDRKYKKKI